ncbi:hypothetical protein D0501_06325 [Leuconostoc holzapfelii]|uniref:DUF4044 domain-containing protein n=1 Tax=Leuconostoc holzapfelii TaxID=434464 RepID=A0ABT2NYL5_9LACO|nr:hypothetical protein [Leuconostoc holzapfelii]MCT8389685.1 hypothetical protein [Leuconostoc holzapfelii]
MSAKDPIQSQINQRLKEARYEPTDEKKGHKQTKILEFLFALLMAVGVIGGSLMLLLKLFIH